MGRKVVAGAGANIGRRAQQTLGGKFHRLSFGIGDPRTRMHFDDCSRHWCNPNHGIFGDGIAQQVFDQPLNGRLIKIPFQEIHRGDFNVLGNGQTKCFCFRTYVSRTWILIRLQGSDFNAMHLGHGGSSRKQESYEIKQILGAAYTGRTMQEVLLYTDGACSGNPGPGGWAWVRLEGERQQEASGADATTTNQRMELEAAAEGLEALTEPANVRLISDSKYVVQGLNEWMDGWIRNGWRNASRKPVANQDLWQRLQTQRERHQLTAEWTRGHAGNTHNERCDQLAVAAIEQLRSRGGAC